MGTIMATVMARTKRTMLRLRSQMFLRALVSLSLFSVLSWFIVSWGVANHLAQRSPENALFMQPDNTEALDARAARLLLTGGGSSESNAAASARDAQKSLGRDATSGVAYRVMGFVYDARGNTRRARALIQFASLSSRRDLPTELWMINDMVAKNDAVGALRHFDAALRTTTAAADILYPVLVGALVEPSLVKPVAVILNRRPAWAADFLSLAVENGLSRENVKSLLGELDEKSGLVTDRLVDQFIRRLYREGRFEEAFSQYCRGCPQAIFPNGDFEKTLRDIPFEWNASTLTDRSSSRVRLANGETALRFAADAEAEGAVGSQQLLLAPGRFDLSFFTGSGIWQDHHKPFVELSCIEPSVVLLRQEIAKGGLQSKEFEVPAGCKLLKFELLVRPQHGVQGLEGWIDKIAIFPLDRRLHGRP